ncbi:DUF1501 domain-containing protein [Vibrio sp. WXL103]|uniref:DUF1501 domain-containing protein n=1 Tax=Vibrio sp. WXL103 TaxID=3450710 RepID=UPI003EC788AA
MKLSRRKFLQSSAAVSATSSLPFALSIPRTALAFGNDGYRAIVCIELTGGNDSANMVVPLSGEFHDAYKSKRPAIAFSQSELLDTGCQEDNGVAVGLHPKMVGVHELMLQGKATSVLGVAPMLGVNKTPPGTRRHNAMRAAWQSSYTANQSLSEFGWGGQIMDSLSTGSFFPELLSSSSNTLLKGRSVSDQQMNDDASFNLMQFFNSSSQGESLYKLHIYQQRDTDCPFMAQYAQEFGVFFDAYEQYTETIKDIGFDPLIERTSSLSRQLSAVKRIIDASANSGVVGGHIFLVKQGGYDTHSNQLNRHNSLYSVLDTALYQFSQALEQSGLSDSVTTFTMSDFGRTTHANTRAGTDHGHGGHQLVLGGAVNGGKVYGQFENMLQSGTGLKGMISHESYAMTLASWLGVDDNTLMDVFPNAYVQFPTNLGFIGSGNVLLKATEDAYVRAGKYSDNVYNDHELYIKGNAKWSSNNKYLRIAYIKFDLGSRLFSGSATLRVFLAGLHSTYISDRTQVKVGIADSGWSEDSLTFNTQPGTIAWGETRSVFREEVGTWVTFDVSSLIANHSGEVTLVLRQTDMGNEQGDLHFSSKDNLDGNVPELALVTL